MNQENAAKKLFILFAFLYATLFVANFAQGATTYVNIVVPSTSRTTKHKSPYAYSSNSGRSIAGQRRYQAKNVAVYDRKVVRNYGY